MVEFSKKQTTRVFARNPQEEPVRKREPKKRKSVRFEEDGNVSTSEFVLKKNQEWAFIANCFELADENRIERRDGEKELLNLCNFYEEKEKYSELNEDSDDSVPFEVFAEQGMRITWQPAVPGSSVSTLRLTSMLRIESRKQDISCYEKCGNAQGFFLDEKNHMEKAFQGVLPCSNPQKANRSRRSSKSEKNDFEPTEDFWDSVEFS